MSNAEEWHTGPEIERRIGKGRCPPPEGIYRIGLDDGVAAERKDWVRTIRAALISTNREVDIRLRLWSAVRDLDREMTLVYAFPSPEDSSE